jgi:nucleoside phosphorylase
MSTVPTNHQQADFLIITSHIEELQEIIKRLPSPASRISLADGRAAHSCELPIVRPDGVKDLYRVVIIQTGIGRVEAAITTSTVIQQLQPRYILLVGTAGAVSLGGLQLGDVLIADQIIDYEQQKYTPEGSEPNWKVYRSDSVLLNSARQVATGPWTNLIRTKRPDRKKIKTHIGPIATGDKIFTSKGEIEQLLKHWPRLIGVEMEAGGVAAAVSNTPSAPGLLMIRTVADIIDDLKDSKNDGWWAYAIAAAAAFTIELLNSAPIKPSQNITSTQKPELGSISTSTESNIIEQNPETTYDTPVSENLAAVVSTSLRPLLPGYDADSSVGIDLLDVGSDADAFASLIAAHATPPPLSIGLFGEWGYGKTFFMRQVKQRVAQLAADAQTSGRLQKEIAYYKRIVQIEFNAWHYVEGNLWASLIEHILFNLNVADASQDEVQALQSKILSELGIQTLAKSEIEAKVLSVKAELTAIESAIADKNEELVKTAESIQALTATNIVATVIALPETQNDIRKLDDLRADLGLSTDSAGLNDLESAINEAEAVVSRGTALLMPLATAPDRVRRIIWLVILLMAGPAVGLLVGWLLSLRGSQWITQIAAILTTFTTWIYVIVGFLQRATCWVAERLTKIERVKQHYESRIKQEEANIRNQISLLERKREQLDAKYSEQQQALAAAQVRVSRLEDDLKHATPVHLLAKFIQDRVESSDYRKHLGVLALVRQDFERMSRFIEAENKRLIGFQTIEDEQDGVERRINRIVLYIDDLDRCPADKVVQVLEAVHLLLAFPLFVVVVAVDARWVSGALNEQYGRLLGEIDSGINSGTPQPGGHGTATPIDYLEKIFQIPFWLSPMSQSARKRMIEGLLAGSLAQGESTTAIGEAVDESAPKDTAPQSVDDESAQLIEEEVIEAGDYPATDLNPEALIIQPAELAFINELSPLLGRSPRALKRFVNIYRLIKSSLSETDHPMFDPSAGETAEFKVAMFFLAIVTNNPSLSQEFFASLLKQLREQNPGHNFSSQVWDKLLSEGNNKSIPDWIYIKTFLHSAAAAPIRVMNTKRLAWWASRVARFSFHVQPNVFEMLELQPDEM